MSGYLEYLPACFGDDPASRVFLDGFLRACEAMLSGGVRLEPTRRVLESTDRFLAVEPLAEDCVVSAYWPAGANRGTFKVWNPVTGRLLRSVEIPSTQGGFTVLDRRRILLDNGEIWDLDSGQRVRTLPGFAISHFPTWAKSGSGARVIDPRRLVASTGNDLQIWDFETGDKLLTLSGHTAKVNAFELLDDGRAVSGSDDGTLRVWDLATGASLVLRGHQAPVNAVVTLGASRIASGSADRTIRIWNAGPGELLHTGAPLPIEVYRLRRLGERGFAASGVSVTGDARVVIAGRSGKPLRAFYQAGRQMPLIEVLAEDRLLIGLHTLEIWDVATGTRLERLVDRPPDASESVVFPWVLGADRILYRAFSVKGAVFTIQLVALELAAHVAIEEEIERLPVLLDPGPHLSSAERAPAELLPWLASWLGATLDPRWPEEARRRLIAEIVPLYRLRGTPAGIARMVRIYTGMEPVIAADPARPHCFKVTIHYHQREPEEIRRLQDEVRRILDREKPAHTWYDLDFEVPTMQIGVHSTVGLDTLLGEETN